MRRLRWRLACIIAPCPILAAPSTDGPAILMREKGETSPVAWIHPKTLTINLNSELGLRRFGDLKPRYEPGPKLGGTIEGTL